MRVQHYRNFFLVIFYIYCSRRGSYSSSIRLFFAKERLAETTMNITRYLERVGERYFGIDRSQHIHTCVGFTYGLNSSVSKHFVIFRIFWDYSSFFSFSIFGFMEAKKNECAEKNNQRPFPAVFFKCVFKGCIVTIVALVKTLPTMCTTAIFFFVLK